MKLPIAGISRRARDLEKYLVDIAHEINSIRLVTDPIAKEKAKALAKSKAKDKKEPKNEKD